MAPEEERAPRKRTPEAWLPLARDATAFALLGCVRSRICRIPRTPGSPSAGLAEEEPRGRAGLATVPGPEKLVLLPPAAGSRQARKVPAFPSRGVGGAGRPPVLGAGAGPGRGSRSVPGEGRTSQGLGRSAHTPQGPLRAPRPRETSALAASLATVRLRADRKEAGIALSPKLSPAFAGPHPHPFQGPGEVPLGASFPSPSWREPTGCALRTSFPQVEWLTGLPQSQGSTHCSKWEPQPPI